MNRMKFFLAATLLTLFSFTSYSQAQVDSLQTLEQRYTQLLRSSETYQEYKVVRRATLNMFWAALNDSVTSSNEQLKAALVSKMELQSQLNEMEAALAEAQTRLNALEGEDAKVKVLGMEMSQSFYHTLLWSLVLAFAGLMSFFLFRHQRNFHIMKETQEDRNGLQKQYDDLRHKSKDMQMKLKRELQTALNRLETVERG